MDQEKDKKTTGLCEHGNFIGDCQSCLNKRKEIFERRAIEQDADGKIILYHATPLENFVKIVQSGSIKPPSETNERTWMLEGEGEGDSDQHKKDKVYLAAEKNAGDTATMLQHELGGSIYILKTRVPETNLKEDEDSRAGNWLDSIDWLGNCSHVGEITDFEVSDKKDYQLSDKRRIEYHKKLSDNPDKEEEILKEMNEEINENIQREEELLEEIKDKI